MKTQKNVRWCILALAICSAIFVTACRTAQEKATGSDAATIVIDGCEYITVENSMSGASNYSFAMTHKGNCKNPIHHWNGGTHD